MESTNIRQMVDSEVQELNSKGKARENADENDDKVMGDYWSPRLSPYVHLGEIKSIPDLLLFFQVSAASSSSVQVTATIFPGTPDFATRRSHSLPDYHSLLISPSIRVVRSFAIQLWQSKFFIFGKYQVSTTRER